MSTPEWRALQLCKHCGGDTIDEKNDPMVLCDCCNAVCSHISCHNAAQAVGDQFLDKTVLENDTFQWFCSQECQRVNDGLVTLTNHKRLIDDSGQYHTELVRCSLQYRPSVQIVDAVAKLFQSAFGPARYVDGTDLIHLVCRGMDHTMESTPETTDGGIEQPPDCTNFRVFVLRKGATIVSAAAIRCSGSLLAEIPYVATREGYRRDGNCRRLMIALEVLLQEIGVRYIVLPAVEATVEIWKNSMGFKEAPEEVCEALEDRIIMPDGTRLLIREVASKAPPRRCRQKAKRIRFQDPQRLLEDEDELTDEEHEENQNGLNRRTRKIAKVGEDGAGDEGDAELGEESEEDDALMACTNCGIHASEDWHEHPETGDILCDACGKKRSQQHQDNLASTSQANGTCEPVAVPASGDDCKACWHCGNEDAPRYVRCDSANAWECSACHRYKQSHDGQLRPKHLFRRRKPAAAKPSGAATSRKTLLATVMVASGVNNRAGTSTILRTPTAAAAQRPRRSRIAPTPAGPFGTFVPGINGIKLQRRALKRRLARRVLLERYRLQLCARSRSVGDMSGLLAGRDACSQGFAELTEMAVVQSLGEQSTRAVAADSAACTLRQTPSPQGDAPVRLEIHLVTRTEFPHAESEPSMQDNAANEAAKAVAAATETAEGARMDESDDEKEIALIAARMAATAVTKAIMLECLHVSGQDATALHVPGAGEMQTRPNTALADARDEQGAHSVRNSMEMQKVPPQLYAIPNSHPKQSMHSQPMDDQRNLVLNDAEHQERCRDNATVAKPTESACQRLPGCLRDHDHPGRCKVLDGAQNQNHRNEGAEEKEGAVGWQPAEPAHDVRSPLKDSPCLTTPGCLQHEDHPNKAQVLLEITKQCTEARERDGKDDMLPQEGQPAEQTLCLETPGCMRHEGHPGRCKVPDQAKVRRMEAAIEVDAGGKPAQQLAAIEDVQPLQKIGCLKTPGCLRHHRHPGRCKLPHATKQQRNEAIEDSPGDVGGNGEEQQALHVQQDPQPIEQNHCLRTPGCLRHHRHRGHCKLPHGTKKQGKGERTKKQGKGGKADRRLPKENQPPKLVVPKSPTHAMEGSHATLNEPSPILGLALQQVHPRSTCAEGEMHPPAEAIAGLPQAPSPPHPEMHGMGIFALFDSNPNCSAGDSIGGDNFLGIERTPTSIGVPEGSERAAPTPQPRLGFDGSTFDAGEILCSQGSSARGLYPAVMPKDGEGAEKEAAGFAMIVQRVTNSELAGVQYNTEDKDVRIA